MNLSEALDAALPEIPRARLTRVHPPRLDPDLIVKEDLLDGEPVIGVFQRSRGHYFQFPPVQWQLFQLFDGVRSYEEIAAAFEEQTGAALSPEDVRQLAQNMDQSEFWYQSPQERNIALNEKLTAQRSRRAKRKSHLNIAHISFSAWDPDRYLTLLDDKIGGFVYSRWCLYSVIALFLFEAIVFIAKWNVIGPDIPLFYNFTKKSFLDFAQFWILFLVLGFFHESAHGLTCKHYGGQVHKMGLMLIYLSPAFYVDVTETWISANKIQRLATIIAGIWVEMIFCGIAMIVWTNTQPGQWMHDFSYEIILITGIAVVVVNLNPLIKLDGYYFLTELIGISDLKERSTALLSGWVQSKFLGLPADLPVVARKRVPFFMLYAFASGLYSYLLLLAVIRFTYNIGFNWFAEFAIIPAGALAFAVFRSRIKSFWGVMTRFWNQHYAKASRKPAMTVSAALLLLALLFAPILRDHEDAYFVIEPARSVKLHAPAAGIVESISIHEGEQVHAGQALLTMKSSNVESLRSSAQAQTSAARFDSFDAQVSHRSQASSPAAQETALRSESIADEAQSSLTLRTPIDGILLTENPESLLIQSVGSGEELLTVADEHGRIARLFVPSAALDRIAPNASVSLDLPGHFRTLHLRLPSLEGNAMSLPPGLIASQDYKGIKLPTFYVARLAFLMGMAICLWACQEKPSSWDRVEA
jgi:putative peptide zinc metalloprotease protein